MCWKMLRSELYSHCSEWRCPDWQLFIKYTSLLPFYVAAVIEWYVLLRGSVICAWAIRHLKCERLIIYSDTIAIFSTWWSNRNAPFKYYHSFALYSNCCVMIIQLHFIDIHLFYQMRVHFTPHPTPSPHLYHHVSPCTVLACTDTAVEPLV